MAEPTPARRRRRRLPLAAQAAAVLGGPVAAAVPLHRLDPRVVNGVALLEVGLFVATLALGSPAVGVPLLVATAGFVALHLADRRAVLALDEAGEATLLRAGSSGRPTAVAGPAGRRPALPEGRGLAVPVALPGGRWWVDRGSFGHLAAARQTTSRTSA